MKVAYIFMPGLLAFSGLSAANVDLNSQVNASYVNHSSESGSSGKRTSNIFTVEPSIGAVYNSKLIQGSADVSYTYLDSSAHRDRDDETFNRQNSFTNFNYGLRLNAIEHILSFRAQGAQSYRNTGANNLFVNDQLFGNQELSKTQRNSAGFDLNLSRGDYIGLVANGQLGKVKSDRQADSDNRLDSTYKSLSGRLFSGKETNYIKWDVAGQYRDNDSSSRNDSNSESYSANIYLPLISHFRLLLTAQDEKNRISSNQTDETRTLDYTSYGAGLSWYESSQRFIDLTYNRSSRENDAEPENFMGVRFAWRFTGRTSASGQYGRRFYGHSAQFNLEHNTKKLRTRVSYSENVTSFARLIIGDINTGVFVCPIGVNDISQCFQPPSLDYQLQPGEEFSALDFFTPEISEATILRKNLQVSTGYSFRKLDVNLTLRDTQSSYLDRDRQQDTQSASISANLKLNRSSSANMAVTFINYDNGQAVTSLASNDNSTTTTLSYRRTLNRDLRASLSYRNTSRSSNLGSRDYDSNRISLELTYTIF